MPPFVSTALGCISIAFQAGLATARLSSLAPSSALLAANKSFQPPQPLGQCIRNTGRACEPYKQGTILNYLDQCQSSEFSSGVSPEMCTVQDGLPSGFCVCGEGYCADSTGVCQLGNGRVLGDSFKITTSLYGPDFYLFMTADGQVQLGQPPTAQAALWRISVGQDGVKQLWTEAYAQDILLGYEQCVATLQNGLTYESCEQVIGHIPNAAADQGGWRIEMHPDSLGKMMWNPFSMLSRTTNFISRRWLGKSASEKESASAHTSSDFAMMLRSAKDQSVLFISPTNSMARACKQTSKSCPGDYGALIFDPILSSAANMFVIDHTPFTNRDSYIFGALFCSILSVTCCICLLQFRYDQPETRFDDKSCELLCFSCCQTCCDSCGSTTARTWGWNNK